jgi:hypothetical protein
VEFLAYLSIKSLIEELKGNSMKIDLGELKTGFRTAGALLAGNSIIGTSA